MEKVDKALLKAKDSSIAFSERLKLLADAHQADMSMSGGCRGHWFEFYLIGMAIAYAVAFVALTIQLFF